MCPERTDSKLEFRESDVIVGTEKISKIGKDKLLKKRRYKQIQRAIGLVTGALHGRNSFTVSELQGMFLHHLGDDKEVGRKRLREALQFLCSNSYAKKG